MEVQAKARTGAQSSVQASVMWSVMSSRKKETMRVSRKQYM